jgi:selenophosphate synthetase-related protein
MTQQQAWHLDRRVPIALIVALAVQTSGIVWWAANLSARVDVHARDIARTGGEVAVLRDAAQTQAVQMGRIEEQISGLRTDIGRLLVAIERGRP